MPPLHTPAKSAFPILLWIGLAFVGGLAIWATVFWLTNGGEDGPRLLVAVGTAGLSLAFGGVLGGVIKKLFDAWNTRKTALDARTEYIAQLMEDFKTVYNMVERARFLILAHQSAKTYGEQMRDLPDAIILLHNIKRATRQGFPNLYKDLEGPIFFCTVFLKALVEEYRDDYYPISKKQSQDEADNKVTRALIAEGTKDRDAEIVQSAWAEIRDLTCLKVLLLATGPDKEKGEAEDFASYNKFFVQHIDLASYALMLRMPGNEKGVRNPKNDKKLARLGALARRLKANRAAGAAGDTRQVSPRV
ncbi:hypothetical protein [uncultured Tateyamaria sp.]|uniref:hypothetical protein n=1 Tax=uncultured Tateyamaria sp. TaxID=455651 RepID=UPI002604F025|nr:hypothetical protein [uncultured Tateyamaria sp.]